MVMGTLTLEPLFVSQFHFVLVGAAGRMRQGGKDVVGAGEGPADFALHPQLLLLISIWSICSLGTHFLGLTFSKKLR